jgi:hypothetical protein
MRLIPALLLLAACAPTQEEFEDESWASSCDLMFECVSAEERDAMGLFWVFGETPDDCYALLDNSDSSDTASQEDDCEYDKQAAKECLQELNALTCDDLTDSSYETPEPCQRVCGEES